VGILFVMNTYFRFHSKKTYIDKSLKTNVISNDREKSSAPYITALQVEEVFSLRSMTAFFIVSATTVLYFFLFEYYTSIKKALRFSEGLLQILFSV